MKKTDLNKLMKVVLERKGGIKKEGQSAVYRTAEDG